MQLERFKREKHIMEKHISAPIKKEEIANLKSGDYVYITGTIYTARDAAHKRMQETLDRGENLPISLTENLIYYMGPSPAREGRPNTCKTRSGNRISRTNNCQPDGSICASSFGSWSCWYDWKRKTFRSSKGSDCA